MGEVGDEDEVEKLKKRVLAMRAHRDAGMASSSSPSRVLARWALRPVHRISWQISDIP